MTNKPHTFSKQFFRLAFLALFFVIGFHSKVYAAPAFWEFVDPNPSMGNGFGKHIVPLITGNVVITSPQADVGGANTGAVYLFDGSTGELISTLTGSSANDQVGSNGVAALTNGNYVVSSPDWDNETAIDAGAVTWANGITGLSGVVSVANSLVGSTSNDQVGNGYVGVTPLTNGNYVVISESWNNGDAVGVGAVTWGNGATGIIGIVSIYNSLVGSTSGDTVGWGGVTPLTNGNYVVNSPDWNSATAPQVGAVTWGNGSTAGPRLVGQVSAVNSLVGSTANDRLGGSLRIVALNNGNYVVVSECWSNGSSVEAGAVTWGNGMTGISGVVSASNSIVGLSEHDSVGSEGVIALTNGNYVVCSPSWSNGVGLYVGAATWGNGTTGTSGVVSEANSLIGSNAYDVVGGSVTALSNGHYVVISSGWSNGSLPGVGAITWGDGTTGIRGVVSVANSLVGSNASDFVGSYGVSALTNGNYVISSPDWDNGTATDAGAVTWVKGDTSFSGQVSSTNSLVGSMVNDKVGHGGVTALANGNYVANSMFWSNGSVPRVGAVTWGNGATGINGPVSSTNSLIGSISGDTVGSSEVTALTNGNYVVCSSRWNNVGVVYAGAVTWGNGCSSGPRLVGPVSLANSLVGSSVYDFVGGGSFNVTALKNGNYVVGSPNWRNVGWAKAGAVTFGDGNVGVVGVINAANSAIGRAANADLQPPVLDHVNNHFVASWYNEGKVRVGSLIDGFVSVPPVGPEIVVEQPSGVSLASCSGHVSFGNVPVGAHMQKTFTVKNTGIQELTLGVISIAGGNAGDFTVTTPPAGPLAATNGITTFTITFSPKTTGAYSATLSLTSNDMTGGENPFVIAFTGSSLSLNQASLSILPNGNVDLIFMSIPAQEYVIQRSTNMQNWTNITTLTAASDGILPFTDSNPPLGGRAFYRTVLSNQ